MLLKFFQEIPQTLWTIATTLGCLLGAAGKTLVLQMPGTETDLNASSLINGCHGSRKHYDSFQRKEANAGLPQTWKTAECLWITIMICRTRPDNLRCSSGTYTWVVSNRCLIILKTPLTGRKLCPVLETHSTTQRKWSHGSWERTYSHHFTRPK